MSCENHKKEVAGISDMKVLAEMIGDLHYETLATLFKELYLKINIDAGKDFDNGRIKLANRVLDISNVMYNAYEKTKKAWQISKPFMEEKTTLNQQ